jgi:DNA polymerase-4
MLPTPDIILSGTLRWLYIDFNSYFASVEQQLRPELRGKPIAVVPVETDSTCAIAASYEAKAYGIRTGTLIYEAKKMCPGIVCVLAQHERYVEYHHRILEEVDKHIPVTAVCSIDEVACRLMNNEIAPERVAEIAHSVKSGLAQNVGKYVRCSIGVAPNRYLAKVATDLQKPDGFTTLTGKDLPDKLFMLKLRDLPGIGYNMEKRLFAAGINTMQQLWQLSPDHMHKIWGNLWGIKMWYLLRGVELPEEETTRSTVGHSHVMAPELRDPAKAKYVARRLTLKAASRLRRMGYYASSFHLAARLETGQRLEDNERCYRAQDSMTFLHLLDKAWTRLMRKAHGARIKKVSISLHGLVAASDLQPELFAELPEAELKQRVRAEKISRALDVINHRFGRDSVLVGMLPSQGRSFSGTNRLYADIGCGRVFGMILPRYFSKETLSLFISLINSMQSFAV